MLSFNQKVLSTLTAETTNYLKEMLKMTFENIKITVQKFEISNKATGEIYGTWKGNGKWEAIRRARRDLPFVSTHDMNAKEVA